MLATPHVFLNWEAMNASVNRISSTLKAKDVRVSRKNVGFVIAFVVTRFVIALESLFPGVCYNKVHYSIGFVISRSSL